MQPVAEPAGQKTSKQTSCGPSIDFVQIIINLRINVFYVAKTERNTLHVTYF